MEFYELVDAQLDGPALQQISIDRLPDYCSSISDVLEHRDECGRIYCIWGEFEVHRQCIRGGVRFTLPGCPNNLAWTLTRNDASGPVVVHLTISNQHHELDFIDSIHTFVADWKAGLERQAGNEHY